MCAGDIVCLWIVTRLPGIIVEASGINALGAYVADGFKASGNARAPESETDRAISVAESSICVRSHSPHDVSAKTRSNTIDRDQSISWRTRTWPCVALVNDEAHPKHSLPRECLSKRLSRHRRKASLVRQILQDVVFGSLFFADETKDRRTLKVVVCVGA